MAEMKCFVCTDHDGLWSVGVASVIFAYEEADAAILLKDELLAHGLNPERAFTLRELDMSKRNAVILNDGDY